MKYSIQLFLILLFAGQVAFAHPGGHYRQADLSSLHHWKIEKNGQPVIGNYMVSNSGFVIAEGINGQMWKLKISELATEDKKYVDSEVGRINEMNSKSNYNAVVEKSPIDKMQLLWFLSTLLCGIGLLLGAYKKWSADGYAYRKYAMALSSVVMLLISLEACKKSNVVPNVIGGDGTIPRTSTSFIDSAFTPYKPAISTSWDTAYFHVSGGGYPQHNMMIGITNWQQQVPIPQTYTGANSWSIPLQPVYATTPLSTRTNLMRGAVAIAVNGIPIFNALNNRGEDSYLIGELDQWGGHCGKGDDYHYHAAPMHLSGTSGLMPIAFALDGFAVYGTNEPDGSSMQTLDSCHGHIYNNGVYHYHGTATYPYVVGAMKGKVILDPTTTAPENQIIPQAFAHPVRPATSPLRGAAITAFTSPSANHYLLTYKIGTKYGYVEYSWNATNLYTYKLTDTAGVVSTQTYQR